MKLLKITVLALLLHAPFSCGMDDDPQAVTQTIIVATPLIYTYCRIYYHADFPQEIEKIKTSYDRIRQEPPNHSDTVILPNDHNVTYRTPLEIDIEEQTDIIHAKKSLWADDVFFGFVTLVISGSIFIASLMTE